MSDRGEQPVATAATDGRAEDVAILGSSREREDLEWSDPLAPSPGPGTHPPTPVSPKDRLGSMGGRGGEDYARSNPWCVWSLACPHHPEPKKNRAAKQLARSDGTSRETLGRDGNKGRAGGTRALLRYMYKYYWVLKSALLFSTQLESGKERLGRLFRAPSPSSPRGGRQASERATQRMGGTYGLLSSNTDTDTTRHTHRERGGDADSNSYRWAL